MRGDQEDVDKGREEKRGGEERSEAERRGEERRGKEKKPGKNKAHAHKGRDMSVKVERSCFVLTFLM